ncbi:hypothetical protein CI102_3752 [Trichoderma harzianum]|nr:hypothetical protein CI102_3752 [Trichoderma harzianum]
MPDQMPRQPTRDRPEVLWLDVDLCVPDDAMQLMVKPQDTACAVQPATKQYGNSIYRPILLVVKVSGFAHSKKETATSGTRGRGCYNGHGNLPHHLVPSGALLIRSSWETARLAPTTQAETVQAITRVAGKERCWTDKDMDRATLAWYSSVLVYTGLVDRITTPRHDACRCLRARGNWHLAMLAANRARALRFPMSKVGSVSPAATALLSTAASARSATRTRTQERTEQSACGLGLQYCGILEAALSSRHTDARLTPPTPNSQCTQSLLRRYNPHEAITPSLQV